MNEGSNKYFSYFRVSSRNQADTGVSLDAQREANIRYAQEKGFEVVKEFREVQSAAKVGRKQFNLMLGEIEKRDDVAGIIFHDVDRSARRILDYGRIEELASQGYHIHYSRDGTELKHRGDFLTSGVKAVVAADYIRNLSQETKKGLYKRVEQGLWVFGHTVPGYRTIGNGLKALDETTAPLIKKTFELYATDQYTLHSLADEMYKRGLRSRGGKKLSFTSIGKILNSKLYAGFITVKEKIYPGKHPPIVTMELFDRVQRTLRRRYPPDRERHKYQFQHMMRCGYCGGTIRSCNAKKRYKYYWCRNKICKSKCVTEGVIEEQIMAALQSIRFSKEQVKDMLHAVRDSRSSMVVVQQEKEQTARLQLDQINSRTSQLVDAYLDGMIDKQVYEQKKLDLAIKQKHAEEEVAKWQSPESLKTHTLEELANLLANPVIAYTKANPYQRRKLMESMMTNLRLYKEGVQFDWKHPFDLLYKTRNASLQKVSPVKNTPRENWQTLVKAIS